MVQSNQGSKQAAQKQQQDGKKPLSQRKLTRKQRAARFKPANKLDIPKTLKDELDQKGFDYRWINAPHVQQLGGAHKNHWEPYKPDHQVEEKPGFGSSPDGYIKRGDLVLGVRDKEVSEDHRAYLDEIAENRKLRADRPGAAVKEEAASQGIQEDVRDETDNTIKNESV